MKHIQALAFLGLIVMTSACASKGRVKEDSSVSPAEAGDSTALIRACGSQPTAGFAYCRITEGTAADQQVVFMAPPAQCSGDSCVFIKVYDQNGAIAWGGSIPKGKTSVGILWKDLLHSEKFDKNLRGFWSFTVRVLWTDDHGIDRTSLSKGDIFLRITAKGYQSMKDVKSDNNYVWNWQEFGYSFKSTSSLRTTVQVLP